MPTKMMPFESTGQAFDAGMCRCVGRVLFEEIQEVRDSDRSVQPFISRRSGIPEKTLEKWFAFDADERFVYPTAQFSNAVFTNILRLLGGLNTLIPELEGARLILAGLQYCFWNHNWKEGKRRATVPNCVELVTLLVFWSETRKSVVRWADNPASVLQLSARDRESIASYATKVVNELEVAGRPTECLPPSSTKESTKWFHAAQLSWQAVDEIVDSYWHVFFGIVDMLAEEDKRRAELLMNMPNIFK